ncbi:lysosomal amino acid transporter 1-like protein [Platysternon megacephalum]|uniref:Solute carrier family 2, facilitated glucose transporter member 5 n=1 Tax=Platysternon megacephalum TaxID=55544 RepID=A0A4D9ETF8_9SAUR|nr:lysosomal amino acid transporter 1-like protein [Platysternon megacephalum]
MAIRLGRKGALLVNNFIAILASILMGISFPTGLFELLMVGRFLIGVNTGVGICVQPLYIGEVAPKHLRGAMAMGSSIFLTGGILTGQIIGLRELLGGEKYWPFLLSSSCFPALAQLFFLPWFPESPRYLLIDRGDEMKCTTALKRFHGPLDYQEEMEDIQRERFALNGEKPKKPWQLFGDRSVKWQLITVIVMTMGQQLSGINAIYFYASYIFKQTGIPAEKIPYVTLGTGACECLTALTCGLLIDYMGRRLLIIGGYTLMSFWCIVLTFSLTYQELYPWVPYLSMASIFAFILSFGLGPGGITNTLTAELFTQSSRPAAYMIGGSVSWLSFFTIGMLFPFIVNGLKQYCFVVFLLESFLVASFIFFVIPETKNKSFLEIKREFQHLNFRGRIKEKEAELCERRQLCNEC